MPSLLEYLSYTCNFMGILAGPLCSYKDYITFIEGRSYHAAQSGESGKEGIQGERTEPSPNVRSGIHLEPLEQELISLISLTTLTFSRSKSPHLFL